LEEEAVPEWEGPSRAMQRLARKRHRGSPWNTALKFIIGAVVVAAVAHEFQARVYERRLNEAIQEVSWRSELTVNCRRVWTEALDFRGKPGFVYWGATEAQVQIDVCHNAWRWQSDPTNANHQEGLLIVAHELAHLVGHFDESETECVAMWVAPDLAVALGGTREDGLAAAAWHQEHVNPKLPFEYQAPGCLAGSEPRSALLR